MNNVVFAYVGLDLSGIIRGWNAAAEKITGYSASEVVGQPLKIFFTPEDIALRVPEREIEQAIHFGKAEDQRWHTMKNGGRFWAVGAMTAIKDEDGTLIGLTKIFRDDSVRKQTEDEMKSANSELNRFAYIVAHDLQNPLRTITSYIQLAMRRIEKVMDRETKEYLTIAIDASKRMRTLISDVLAYSQSQSRLQLMERVDCNAVVQEALANLREDLDTTEANVSTSALPVLPGVASQLAQVFQNLIGNALKYRKPDVPLKIQIDVTQTAQVWEFSVKDNGIGIEDQDKDRIFQAFERGHSETHHQAGSGLGLSICRRIIEQHGGKIWVESTLGGGSTFCFTLPAGGNLDQTR
jgi:PAS domain S-box-containing protein